MTSLTHDKVITVSLMSTFVLLIAVVGIGAYLQPDPGRAGGILENVVLQIGAPLIFASSGLATEGHQLLSGITRLRTLCAIIAWSYCVLPIVTLSLVNVMLVIARVHRNSPVIGLARGLVATACLPMPVSTSLLVSRAAGADEPTAIVSSVIGSMVGLVMTPLLLLQLLGMRSSLSSASLIVKVMKKIVLPLAFGFGAQTFLRKRGRELITRISKIASKGIILGIIFCCLAQLRLSETSPPRWAVVGCAVAVFILQ